MSTEGGVRAVVAALLANLGIAVSKFGAFFVTGSSSMLTEGVHSLADSGNQVLLLIGGRRALRADSNHHQFGYGRIRYVYAFVVAIVLFTVGGLFSLYEGVHKFQHPEALGSPTVAIVVLVIAIALESFSLRTAVREVNHVRGKRTLWQFVRASRQPELPVILLEDIGALTGLCFALVGVGMTSLTGDARWDGLGAMAVGGLLVIIAVILAVEMSSMLVGESALAEDQAAIAAALAATPIVRQVIHLRTLYVGPDELLVAAKLGVDPVVTAVELSAGIDDCERRVREVVPSARYIFLEPDIYRAAAGG